ncbi:CBU_0592 family membrane protein [Hyphococcus lacteus]|uniref:CBU-0592-like domain-containing protein n=1 Tax=Hyphococcus lacteus TaxID=3143536 RepID=A0ABV3Z101_9PROT
MQLTVPDFVGFVGVALVVGTYFLSQMGRMDVRKPLYPGLNGIGAILILYSLSNTFNAASFVIEVFWLVISAAGLIRALLLKSR